MLGLGGLDRELEDLDALHDGELDLLEVVQPRAQRGDLVLEPLDVFDGGARLQSVGVARDALLDQVNVGLHTT